MSKPVLVSGIQPTGRMHLGNYLGALRNFVELQNSGKYDCYFFLADLHSLTENYTPQEKREQITELTADFIAAGLNPKNSVIFQQSLVPAHAELGWILNTITPLGELFRMTQFKEKSPMFRSGFLTVASHNPTKEDMSFINRFVGNAGLLDYPVLMAADILLYDAEFVPVGEDQVQHLELTRTLARKFNKRFGQTFVEPRPILTKTARVMSLTDPEKKMSKSQPESCLFLDDPPEDIRKKVKRAVTDSGSEVKFDPNKKKAVSNLLSIYSGLSGQDIPSLEKKYRGKTYSEFKSDLAEVVIEALAPFRGLKPKLLAKPKELLAVLENGSAKAAGRAEKKIAEVKKRMGLC